MGAGAVMEPATERRTASAAIGRSFRAIDISAEARRRELWRRGGSGEPEAARDLPPGIASPMGFWLAPAARDGVATPDPGFTLTVASPKDPAPEPSEPPTKSGDRPTLTVRVKSPASGEGDVQLTIGPKGARVVASKEAWEALSEPILLVVSQYWRFRVVDAEVDRLTEFAHADLDHATMPGLSSLRQRKRLGQAARAVRALLVDLPHFQGPLTDPYPYLSSERAVQVYWSLSEKLRLEEWCEAIDERCEAVEDAYEAVTEKLFEYKNFAIEAVLEVIIVLILVGELGLMIADFVMP